MISPFGSRDPGSTAPLSLLGPPYEDLVRMGPSQDLNMPAQGGGWVVVWELGHPLWESALDAIRERPGGLALVLILPEGNEIGSVTRLLRIIESCRPQTVLPYHVNPKAREIAQLVSRPPAAMSTEITDYLAWRGLRLDPGTARIIRRMVELSEVARTVSGLSKGLYMSRRALGRRFLSRGLPVPSHWLHLSRILRAALRLQNTDASLFSVACSLGYPDGFSLSNQMHRLCGVRPTEARTRLGWEWILESWIVRELETGGLTAPGLTARASLFPRRQIVRRPMSMDDSRAISVL